MIIIYNKTVCHQCKGLYLELTESVLTERLVLVFILDFDLGKPSKNKPKMAYSRDALLERDKRETREIWSYGGWPIIV